MNTFMIVQTLIYIDDEYVDIESADCLISTHDDDRYGKFRILANNRVIEIEDSILIFWYLFLRKLKYLELNSEIVVSAWDNNETLLIKYNKSRQFVIIEQIGKTSLKVSRDAFISSILTAGQSVIRSIARISPDFQNADSIENELFQAFGINKQ